MRKIHLLGVALIAIFAFGAVGASSAFAESELLDSGEAIPSGTLISSELMTPIFLSYEDGIKSAEVKCEKGTNEGTILSGTEGILEAAACSEEGKSVSGGCEAPITISAANLPWKITLSLSEMELATILADGAGEPGWKVVCKSLLGEQNVLCVQPSITTLVENDAGGNVLVEFDATSETESANAKCSDKGTPEGKALILAGTDILIMLKENDGLLLSID